ncbi:hypothetical protein A0H81_01105 [Grifola frondosa]|uniref:Uncharacterized protein n=1 Tax=Grifola frondosa TaxID=5627 RepID=A0A1C7MPW7_GRIFR|nr:hypothetical protein A0H81_01105 [Grifola frondosa]
MENPSQWPPANSQSHIPPPSHPTIERLPSPALPGPSGSNTSPTPPKLPPRPVTFDSSTIHNAEETLPRSASTDTLVASKAEEELSEVQLRELYDDEEIDRFLHLFSAYVQEVRVPGAHHVEEPPEIVRSPSRPESDVSSISGDVDGYAPVAQPAARVALDFIIPLLPPARSPPPEFTLHRLKLTAQRAYLAIEPLYSYFIVRALRLVTWQDPNTSFLYCAAYWLSWYHDVLFAAIILRLLYALIRRKVLPYPNLAELREHRRQVDRAQEFGAAISMRLVASPAFGVKDVWHVFKDLNHSRKLKKAAKASHPKNGENDGETIAVDPTSENTLIIEESTDSALQITQNQADDADLKRIGLHVLNEITDLFERIKNIFLWRQPATSIMYGLILIGLFFVSLLPVRYLTKTAGFAVGVFFWHVIPVITAIPPPERARFPPLFSGVPTDAEYAMELISQRVARGLDVKPKPRKNRSRPSVSELGASGAAGTEERQAKEEGSSTSINWKKWGERITSTKERTGDLKKIFQDGQWKNSDSWLSLNPLVPKVATSSGMPEPRLETHTFAAQHLKSPGLITLTSGTLFFTPLLSARAKLTISLEDVLGVKKTVSTHGVSVRYAEASEDGRKEEKEAKFMSEDGVKYGTLCLASGLLLLYFCLSLLSFNCSLQD